MAKIDTGIKQTVKVTLPRPGPVGKGRGAVIVKPGTIAVHAGETVESMTAFAQAICDAWEQYRAKRGSLGAPTGKDMTMQAYESGSEQDIAFREKQTAEYRVRSSRLTTA